MRLMVSKRSYLEPGDARGVAVSCIMYALSIAKKVRHEQAQKKIGTKYFQKPLVIIEIYTQNVLRGMSF